MPSFGLTVDNKFHTFRNESELKTEAKGGYIRGTMALPDASEDGEYSVELSVAAGRDNEANEHGLHPNLLVASGTQACGSR